MHRTFKYHILRREYEKIAKLNFENVFTYAFIIIIPCRGDKVLNYLGN